MSIVYQVKVADNGTQTWKLNGKLHREDGPAVIYADGDQYWYREGKFHRAEGPAITKIDGTQQWWVNGQLHRLDGPAGIDADGCRGWYVDDRQYFDNKDFQEAAKITDEEMSFMIIKYGNVE